MNYKSNLSSLSELDTRLQKSETSTSLKFWRLEPRLRESMSLWQRRFQKHWRMNELNMIESWKTLMIADNDLKLYRLRNETMKIPYRTWTIRLRRWDRIFSSILRTVHIKLWWIRLIKHIKRSMRSKWSLTNWILRWLICQPTLRMYSRKTEFWEKCQTYLTISVLNSKRKSSS